MNKYNISLFLCAGRRDYAVKICFFEDFLSSRLRINLRNMFLKNYDRITEILVLVFFFF